MECLSPRGWIVAALLSCAVSAQANHASEQAASPTDLRTLIDHYQADRAALSRFYSVAGSPARASRLRALAEEWLGRLQEVDFEALDQDGRIDWLLLRSEIEGHRGDLERGEQRTAEIAPWVGYAPAIVELAEARQRVDPFDAEEAARRLDRLRQDVEQATLDIEERPKDAPAVARSVAVRAARRVHDLGNALQHWYSFRAGYDPIFTWWNQKPYEALKAKLAEHEKRLREKLAGLKPGDEETIVGDPIGRDALVLDLAKAWIPYTPEELIEIADQEFAWCRAEMLAASRAMGCGDDWKQALERVKEDHVAPGEQPALIQALAREAWTWVEEHDLVTVPPLAKEVWRMNMLSPEAQRTSPFFLGGESIRVAYPTDSMTDEEKRMSMRGNNRHFCRATVHHEVIPGHHLQGFMNDRWFTYRGVFGTPFWTEGWALWWEMLLYQRGFFATPEDKVGALFWRMHRCARIRFSLGFHLGLMTPEQCIDYLVEEVGHERENAEAEVRRSFNGDYGPLYQLAYMVGALQFRALHTELVGGGKTSDRAFHDAILQSGTMPIELVRARLAEVPLTRETRTGWRFYP